MTDFCCPYKDGLKTIQSLSIKEKKTLLERMVKLQEESGELAQEVLIFSKSSGMQDKKPGKDGIKGESIDVVLVALSIFFQQGGSIQELEELMSKKSKSWEKI